LKNVKSNASVPGDKFEWPEFATDKARIRAYSQRFKNKSVLEAFQDVYGVDLSGVSEKANELPREYKVGDKIKTRLANVAKDSVEFEGVNYKGTVLCSANLNKYRKLRGGSQEEITAVVTDVKRGRITLDPIKPMTEDWINNTVADPVLQNVLGDPRTIKVRNLQLTAGGFTGKAVIPATSAFVGEEYTVDAFIPGSQIVLNITDDFEQFIGKDVDAFVLNYIPKGDGMSLICSVKAYLTFLGNERLIEMFNRWCEDSPKWEKYSKEVHGGKVTGVINSAKKCGVFVEVPDLNITGMVKVPADELVNYKPGDNVGVHLSSFDEETFYNKEVQQVQHVEPYIIEDGVLVKCNLKPILAFVTDANPV
jgi:ribosomal protein S1